MEILMGAQEGLATISKVTIRTNTRESGKEAKLPLLPSKITKNLMYLLRRTPFHITVRTSPDPMAYLKEELG